jgi:hypothetical protein
MTDVVVSSCLCSVSLTENYVIEHTDLWPTYLCLMVTKFDSRHWLKYLCNIEFTLTYLTDKGKKFVPVPTSQGHIMGRDTAPCILDISTKRGMLSASCYSWFTPEGISGTSRTEGLVGTSLDMETKRSPYPWQKMNQSTSLTPLESLKAQIVDSAVWSLLNCSCHECCQHIIESIKNQVLK